MRGFSYCAGEDYFFPSLFSAFFSPEQQAFPLSLLVQDDFSVLPSAADAFAPSLLQQLPDLAPSFEQAAFSDEEQAAFSDEVHDDFSDFTASFSASAFFIVAFSVFVFSTGCGEAEVEVCAVAATLTSAMNAKRASAFFIGLDVFTCVSICVLYKCMPKKAYPKSLTFH